MNDSEITGLSALSRSGKKVKCARKEKVETIIANVTGLAEILKSIYDEVSASKIKDAQQAIIKSGLSSINHTLAIELMTALDYWQSLFGSHDQLYRSIIIQESYLLAEKLRQFKARLQLGILHENHKKTVEPKNSKDDLMMTAKEGAALLKISERAFHKRRQAGRLPKPIKIGRSTRWRREELLKWVKAGCPNQVIWEREYVK